MNSNDTIKLLIVFFYIKKKTILVYAINIRILISFLLSFFIKNEL